MREESESPGQDDREQNHFCPNLLQALGVSYQKWVHRATLHDPKKYGIKKNHCLNAFYVLRRESTNVEVFSYFYPDVCCLDQLRRAAQGVKHFLTSVTCVLGARKHLLGFFFLFWKRFWDWNYKWYAHSTELELTRVSNPWRHIGTSLRIQVHHCMVTNIM